MVDSNNGSSDDEPLLEAEGKAFIEGLREQHRKFWHEEFLPHNPLLKHYTLNDDEEVCDDDNAKVRGYSGIQLISGVGSPMLCRASSFCFFEFMCRVSLAMMKSDLWLCAMLSQIFVVICILLRNC